MESSGEGVGFEGAGVLDFAGVEVLGFGGVEGLDFGRVGTDFGREDCVAEAFVELKTGVARDVAVGEGEALVNTESASRGSFLILICAKGFFPKEAGSGKGWKGVEVGEEGAAMGDGMPGAGRGGCGASDGRGSDRAALIWWN